METIINTLPDEDCFGDTTRPQAWTDDHGYTPCYGPNSNTLGDRAKLAIPIFGQPFDVSCQHNFVFNVPGKFDSLAAVRTAKALRMASPVLILDDTSMDITAVESSFTTKSRLCDLEPLQAALDWTVALDDQQWAVPLEMHRPFEIHHQDPYAGLITPWGGHVVQAPMHCSRSSEQSICPQSAAIEDDTWGAMLHSASV